MMRDRLGVAAWEVTDIGTAVVMGVTIQALAVKPFVRHADAIRIPDDGREVVNDDGFVVTVFRLSHVCQHAVLVALAVDPFKAVAFEVDLVERWKLAVQSIEIGNKLLDALMGVPLQQVPLQ